MSPVLSRLSHFCWLFFPPFILFSCLLAFYSFNQRLVNTWLNEIEWLSYVSLAIAAAIAWQFGRSRLVYACVLVVLVSIEHTVSMPSEWIDSRFITLLLGFIYLLYTKDKGFSVISLCMNLSVFIALFLCAWLVFPYLESAGQTSLAKIQAWLFQLSADMLTYLTPLQGILFISTTLLGLIRLAIKTDNTHNAIFFGLVITALMQFSPYPELNLMGALALCALFCFAVIKDSFTMAFKDELTGIPSRRALMQYVNTLGRKYTVVMSDIDHFKKFNDTYGHDVGDEVLKLVASKLAKVMGGGKTFRFGGEEFVMVFPRKSASEVVPFVEVCRQVIADYDIALRAKPRPPKPKKGPAKKPSKEKIVKVTSSFGIAQRTQTHTEFSQVMKQADISLYAAKKAGRNCVKVAKQ